MTDSLYLLGAPGVGKSTVLAQYLRDRGYAILPDNGALRGRLRGHIMVGPNGVPDGVYLGKMRDQFPGTDGLSMAVAPDARDWARSLDGESTQWELVVGEGARLGNKGFLHALGETTHLTVVLLTATEATLTERRAARGSNQTPSWMRGAETAARNAYDAAVSHACRVMEFLTDEIEPAEIASRLP